ARPHQGLPRARHALVLPGGRRLGRLRARGPGRGAGRGGVAPGGAGRGGRLRARRRAALAARARGHAGARGVRVGIVGCGVISAHYAANAAAFDAFELVACADLATAQAEALGERHGLAVMSVSELVADPSIDLVLNLTPAAVHAEVSRAALEA